MTVSASWESRFFPDFITQATKKYLQVPEPKDGIIITDILLNVIPARCLSKR